MQKSMRQDHRSQDLTFCGGEVLTDARSSEAQGQEPACWKWHLGGYTHYSKANGELKTY